MEHGEIKPADPFIICAILDASTSMIPRKYDVLAGFNRFVREQQTDPNPATLYASTFSTTVTSLFAGVDIHTVPTLDDRHYICRGMTALYDAVGAGLAALREAYPGKRRGIVMVVTDGEENASHLYRGSEVASTIAAMKLDGWEFVYLGADANAWGGARGLGMRFGQYDNTQQGTQAMYRTLSANVGAMRRGKATGSDLVWSSADVAKTDGVTRDEPPQGPKGFTAGGKRFRRG